MSFTPIPDTTPLNLVPFRMSTGDDDEFITKTNGQQAALESYLANLHNAISAINTLGTELAAAEVSDQASIAAFQATLDSKVAAIDAATSGLSALLAQVNALGISDVNLLPEQITALQTADQAEINNRQNAVQTLQDTLTALQATVAGLGINSVATLGTRLSDIEEDAVRETANRTAADINLDTRIDSLDTQISNYYTISGADLAALQTTADQIAALVASAGGLTTASVAGLDDDLARIQINPLKQLLPNGGILASGDLPETFPRKATALNSILNDNASSDALLLRMSNVEVVEYHRVNYERSQNGAVQDSLINAFGRAGNSSSYSMFNIVKLRVIGTIYPWTFNGVTRYLLADSKVPVGIDNYATFAAWVRSDTQDGIAIYGSSYLDGSSTPVISQVLPDTDWHHYTNRLESFNGYVNSSNALYGAAGTEFYMALPVLTQGKCVIPPHYSPIW